MKVWLVQIYDGSNDLDDSFVCVDDVERMKAETEERVSDYLGNPIVWKVSDKSPWAHATYHETAHTVGWAVASRRDVIGYEPSAGEILKAAGLT